MERASRGEPSLVTADSQSAVARAGGQLRLQTPLGSADERPPRLYKLDFPTYNGEGDPRPWLTRCNLFFLGQRTPDTDKTWMASYHLTDVAALWYGHLEEKIGRPTWADFVARVSQHFGPPTRANPFGELISLRRTGSVAEYTKQFLQLLSRINPIPDDEERNIFTNNLGEPLKTQVELLRPATLEDAMDMAVSYEHLAMVTTVTAATPTRPGRPTRPVPAAPGAATGDPSSGGGPVFKKLNAAEMEDRRSKGLCFNCDEKYVSGHRCKRLFYIESADDDEEDNGDNLHISLLAITGVRTSDTMQLVVRVGERELVALLDSGSTHNFISEEMAAQVGSHFTTGRRLRVIVANGDHVTCPRRLPCRSLRHPLGWV